MTSKGLATSALLLSAFAGGCGALSDAPNPPFEVRLRVESDPGEPLGGATITRAGSAVATTDVAGIARLSLQGAEGDAVDLSVQCPSGYQSPPHAVSVTLRRIADPSKVPEFPVSCPPLVRHIVVAVRAENGPNIPVVYLDRVVATTDSAGAAHAAIEAPPGEQVRVVLDTSGPEHEKLRPESPSRVFVVGARDEVFVFDQKLEREKPKFVPRPRGPQIPRPLRR